MPVTACRSLLASRITSSHARMTSKCLRSTSRQSMEHGIWLNRRHGGSDDIVYALSPMSDQAEGATNGISFVRAGGEGLRHHEGDPRRRLRYSRRRVHGPGGALGLRQVDATPD